MKTNAIRAIAELKRFAKLKNALTEKELKDKLHQLSDKWNITYNIEIDYQSAVIIINPHDKNGAVMDYEKEAVIDLCEEKTINDYVKSAGKVIKTSRIDNKNAYIIECENGTIYQSYQTPIAVKLHASNRLTMRRDYNSFSVTTTQHANEFQADCGYLDIEYVL